MTIRERLRAIGQAWTNEPEVKSVEVPKKKSFLLGTFLDLGTKSLSNEKSISTKLLESFYGWVYINVTTLAEEVSKFEPELYKTTIKGGEIVAEPVTDSPLLDLLDRFNGFTSRADGFYLTEAYLELTGDCFWYLEGGENGGQPKAIYLLQPDKVELKIGEDGKVNSYIFKTIVDTKTKEVEYPAEAILHVKTPNPTNPYRGHSVIEGIAQQLDIDAYATQTTRSFYENGMMANFALSTDQKLTSDQVQKLRAEMRSAYQGTANAFKVPIFGGGIEPKTLTMSSKDAEQIKQQTWLRDQIMAAFKNTKASLGITEDVNRANAEATIDFWRQSVILPKMQRIASAINEFIVPRYGENLILGVCDPAGEDYDSQMNKAIKLKGAGIITRNEAREIVGYDQVEGGELFPEQYVLDKPENTPKSLRNVDYKRIIAKSGVLDQRNKYRKELLPEAKKIVQEMHKPKVLTKYHSYTKQQAMDFSEKQIEIVNSQEAQFLNAINQYLEGLTKRTIANVTTLLTQKQYQEELWNEEEELEMIVAALVPILALVAVTSGNNANKLINVDTPFVLNPSKQQQIQAQAIKFGKSMLSTDADRVSNIITNGLQQGFGPNKVAGLIQEQMPEFTKAQAQRVARSELLRAANRAGVEAWRDAGFVVAKEWATDADPCVYCAPLNGKIIEIERDYFDLGSEWLGNGKTPITLGYTSIGYPPLHPNCECTILPVLKGDQPITCNFEPVHKTYGDLKPACKSGKCGGKVGKLYRVDDPDYPLGGGGGDLIGNGTYFTRTKLEAAQYGNNISVYSTGNITNGQILGFESQAHFDSIYKKSVLKYPKLNWDKAIPKYLQSKGYIGAETLFSGGANGEAGLVIFSNKILEGFKKLRTVQASVSDEVTKLKEELEKEKEYISELENILELDNE